MFRLKMGWMLWLGSCLLLGCRPESDIKVLRLAHTLDTTHPVHAALVFMAKELETRSAGRMRIKIYPGSQLGSERETIELLQLGAVDLVKTSTSPLEGFIPGMGIFGIPYVFRGSEHFWKVLEGEIGQEPPSPPRLPHLAHSSHIVTRAAFRVSDASRVYRASPASGDRAAIVGRRTEFVEVGARRLPDGAERRGEGALGARHPHRARGRPRRGGGGGGGEAGGGRGYLEAGARAAGERRAVRDAAWAVYGGVL